MLQFYLLAKNALACTKNVSSISDQPAFYSGNLDFALFVQFHVAVYSLGAGLRAMDEIGKVRDSCTNTVHCKDERV